MTLAELNADYQIWYNSIKHVFLGLILLRVHFIMINTLCWQLTACCEKAQGLLGGRQQETSTVVMDGREERL